MDASDHSSVDIEDTTKIGGKEGEVAIGEHNDNNNDDEMTKPSSHAAAAAAAAAADNNNDGTETTHNKRKRENAVGRNTNKNNIVEASNLEEASTHDGVHNNLNIETVMHNDDDEDNNDNDEEEEKEEEIDEDEDNDDDEAEEEEEDSDNDDNDDVTDSSSEEEEEEEEEPDIPTPDEVEIEYTFPQDFWGCRSWQDVVARGQFFRLIIDPSCMGIPYNFFKLCFGLIELVFAENSRLTEIGAGAFQQCENLQRMNAFPVGLLRLRRCAFIECCSLPGELVIPSKVVLVDSQCFRRCTAVTSVVFHDNLTPAANPVELRWFVFANCIELQSVRLPQNIVSIPEHTFSGCTSLRNIPLPLSVEEVEKGAFYLCTSLQSLNLPARTTRIGHRAYRSCTSLAKVTIRANEVLDCGREVFDDCPALATIQVYPSVWMTLFESMNTDPSFLFHFIRKYQVCKWTA